MWLSRRCTDANIIYGAKFLSSSICPTPSAVDVIHACIAVAPMCRSCVAVPSIGRLIAVLYIDQAVRIPTANPDSS